MKRHMYMITGIPKNYINERTLNYFSDDSKLMECQEDYRLRTYFYPIQIPLLKIKMIWHNLHHPCLISLYRLKPVKHNIFKKLYIKYSVKGDYIERRY